MDKSDGKGPLRHIMKLDSDSWKGLQFLFGHNCVCQLTGSYCTAFEHVIGTSGQVTSCQGKVRGSTDFVRYTKTKFST